MISSSEVGGCCRVQVSFESTPTQRKAFAYLISTAHPHEFHSPNVYRVSLRVFRQTLRKFRRSHHRERNPAPTSPVATPPAPLHTPRDARGMQGCSPLFATLSSSGPYTAYRILRPPLLFTYAIAYCIFYSRYVHSRISNIDHRNPGDVWGSRYLVTQSLKSRYDSLSFKLTCFICIL